MLGDPIVIDLALTELGWFEQFFETRGPLLPDDEALLATSWLLVDRTVYEIEATRPGDGVVVRDLRTGEHLDVRERTMSAQATVGQMVCARALPDSVTNQFVGSVFHVPPGREREVLELCDNGDAFALCKYVAALRRPPRFATRENEPLVSCTVVARVRDPAEARRVLDDAYESDDDGWMEMHELSDDERIVRGAVDARRRHVDGVDTIGAARSSGCWRSCGLRSPIWTSSPTSACRSGRAPAAGELGSGPPGRASTPPSANRSSTRWSSGGCGNPCPRWAVSRRSRPPPTPRGARSSSDCSLPSPNRPTGRP